MKDSHLHLQREQPGKWASLALTIAVHVGLVAFLVFGIRWQSTPPGAMEVELVAAPAARPAPPPPPPPEPEVKPEPKPEPPKPEPPKPAPKPEPKPEPKAQPKPDIATKAPKPEPKKPEPKKPEPKKPEPKPEPKKPEPKIPEPKPEPKKPLAEKPKTVTPQKDDYIERRMAEELAAADMNRVLREGEARAAAARSATARDAYANAIRTKVRGNLLRPPGLVGNPEAIFEVDQLPSGEVLNVRLKRSSGVPALDDAIERAIRRSSPLPQPKDAELFERTLELKFRPLDE